MYLQQITQEYYTIITLIITLNAFIATPILRYIYDPSKRYINYKRRTIQHSRQETELKVLVCIHQEEEVFGIMKILKVFHPTKKTPILTYTLDLMELVGRITPIFINHQFHRHRSPTAKTNRTDRIISAFQQFESQYEGLKCYNFTAIAPYNSMHDEICTLALDKSVSFLIISFKKADTTPVRGVMRNVLDKAPCSVGILINKRIVLSRNAHSLSFHVCVAFLGGPDAREALAFAMRMLQNISTRVTVIRLIAEEEFVSDLLEIKLDMRAIAQLKSLNGDEGAHVQYREVIVKDGAHTIEVLRSIDNEYDLVLVGRRLDADSPLVSGLADWTYEPELGIVGDVLASTDIKSTGPVLVIQQQSTISGSFFHSFKGTGWRRCS